MALKFVVLFRQKQRIGKNERKMRQNMKKKQGERTRFFDDA